MIKFTLVMLYESKKIIDIRKENKAQANDSTSKKIKL